MFDAAVERVRAAGATVVTDVHVNPNAHHREIWLQDPDGYLVVLAEADWSCLAFDPRHAQSCAMPEAELDPERQRLADDGGAWRRWGPYLSERAWGTVREDYSADGEAWTLVPARPRPLAGLPLERGRARRDLRHRPAPLPRVRVLERAATRSSRSGSSASTSNEGNHGEDAKEYWWYLDSTPTHSWMRWRYLYPQARLPVRGPRRGERRRGFGEPEYELLDTGAFDDDRYWDVEVDYAKAGPDDLCMRVRVRNAGPDAATLHVLPTLWFRNRWSWERRPRRRRSSARTAARSSRSTTTARR